MKNIKLKKILFSLVLLGYLGFVAYSFGKLKEKINEVERETGIAEIIFNKFYTCESLTSKFYELERENKLEDALKIYKKIEEKDKKYGCKDLGLRQRFYLLKKKVEIEIKTNKNPEKTLKKAKNLLSKLGNQENYIKVYEKKELEQMEMIYQMLKNLNEY